MVNVKNSSVDLSEVKEESIREVIITAKNYTRPDGDKRIQSVKVSLLLKHRSKPIEIINAKGDAVAFNDYEKVAMSEWLKLFPQNTKNKFLVRYLEEKGISTRIEKSDVRFQKDL